MKNTEDEIADEATFIVQVHELFNDMPTYNHFKYHNVDIYQRLSSTQPTILSQYIGGIAYYFNWIVNMPLKRASQLCHQS